jgi:hypothetical protein
MARKSLMRAAALLLFSLGLSAAAYAQVTISGGFALSYMSAESTYQSIEGDIGVGGNLYVDWLLPIRIPLSIGVEAGVDTSSFTAEGWTDTVFVFPILARVAYHFDLMPKLDLYLVGKAGVAFGSWSGPSRDYALQGGGNIDLPPGLAFGIDLGVAYYFTSVIGIFAEAGFDRYGMSAKVTGRNVNGAFDVPFSRFLTAGLSVKF